MIKFLKLIKVLKSQVDSSHWPPILLHWPPIINIKEKLSVWNKENSNTRKLRKNSELLVEMELRPSGGSLVSSVEIQLLLNQS